MKKIYTYINIIYTLIVTSYILILLYYFIIHKNVYANTSNNLYSIVSLSSPNNKYKEYYNNKFQSNIYTVEKKRHNNVNNQKYKKNIPKNIEYHSSAEKTQKISAKSTFHHSQKIEDPPIHSFLQMTSVAIPLIVGGLFLNNSKAEKNIHNLRNDYVPKFDFHYEDYLQFAPGAAMLGLKLGGLKGRSSWARMLFADAISIGLMLPTVEIIKVHTKKKRPTGSSHQSFPSGHTANAFMLATMLHKEYGETRNRWYSILGYTAATATAIGRQLNNRHWLSDTMVGAGIGIMSTEIGYLLTDLIFEDKGIILPIREPKTIDKNRRPSFLGLYAGINQMSGKTKIDGVEISAGTGANVGIEGALFFNPYIGVGGKFSAANLPILKDGKLQKERYIDILSGYGGLYFSYPLTRRIGLGSKVLAGYNYYRQSKSLPSSSIKIGGKKGLGIGTGASIHILANDSLSISCFLDYNFIQSPLPKDKKLRATPTLGLSTNIAF